MERKLVCEEDILCRINIPQDRRNMTELEREHLPVIECPKMVDRNEYFEVKIKVGEGVNILCEPTHFIEWIELYAGDTFVGRTNFNGVTSYPITLFKLRMTHADSPLKVWAKCNLHGLWESSEDICIAEM